MTYKLLASLLVVISMCAPARAIDWPMAPRDAAQPIGNSWGQYQYFGFSYLHPGMDVMGYSGKPVYAVKSGWVKAVLTTIAELHWRVAVGDSAGSTECDGWLYAHLDRYTITVEVGDYVNEGDLLGELVEWPVAEFHHLHFANIRRSGQTWQPDWSFVRNPLCELSDISDLNPPVFLDMPFGGRLAFCRNESADYFYPGDSLSGDVDIVARVFDMIGHPTWRCAPYRLDYFIKSDTIVVDTTMSFLFGGLLEWEDNVGVIYKEDSVLRSLGDYDGRDFYFVVTNTDGDSVVESEDAANCWKTGNLPNGLYTVFVIASDAYGNRTVDSMTVRTANYYSLKGTVTASDGNPDMSSTVVTAQSMGVADTCDLEGHYDISGLPIGQYAVIFSRSFYETETDTVDVSGAVTLDVVLSPAAHVSGDADWSGGVDIADVVYLITYVFSGGSSPQPYAAGDADGSLKIDIADVVYLITYIFAGGSPPIG